MICVSNDGDGSFMVMLGRIMVNTTMFREARRSVYGGF